MCELFSLIHIVGVVYLSVARKLLAWCSTIGQIWCWWGIFLPKVSSIFPHIFFSEIVRSNIWKMEIFCTLTIPDCYSIKKIWVIFEKCWLKTLIRINILSQWPITACSVVDSGLPQSAFLKSKDTFLLIGRLVHNLLNHYSLKLWTKYLNFKSLNTLQINNICLTHWCYVSI